MIRFFTSLDNRPVAEQVLIILVIPLCAYMQIAVNFDHVLPLSPQYGTWSYREIFAPNAAAIGKPVGTNNDYLTTNPIP
jgi:hypothetical protein